MEAVLHFLSDLVFVNVEIKGAGQMLAEVVQRTDNFPVSLVKDYMYVFDLRSSLLHPYSSRWRIVLDAIVIGYRILRIFSITMHSEIGSIRQVRVNFENLKKYTREERANSNI